MKCTNCGANIPEGNLFCTRCGAKAEIIQRPRDVAQQSVPYPGGGKREIVCPTCGAAMPEGYAFCTNCGGTMTGAAAAKAPGAPETVCQNCGASVPAGNRFCIACGAPMGGTMPQPKRKKSYTGVWVALICLLLGLVALFAALFFTGALDDMLGIDREETEERDRRDDDDEERGASSRNKSEAAAEADDEDDKEDAEETETPSPEPTASQAPSVEGDVRIAVNNYLSAFIQDINAGQYSQLYSYVQAGSPMESSQKDFIAKSAPQNLNETLLDSQIESVSKQNDSTYYVTVLEHYEVRGNADPYHWWVKQRCTYQVNLQSDGSWKIANFVGSIQNVDKGVY